MEQYTLYMHVNKNNHKKYIGLTNNIQRRWRCGGIEYKPHSYDKQNRKFWNAIVKYGFDSFEHVVLLENLTFEEACEKEVEYIKKHDATNRNKGYNVAIGGNGGLIYSEHPRGMKGKNQTEYQKESHSKWASDEKNNCMKNGKVIWDVTHKHPRGMVGKTHSEEYKKQVSKFMSEQHPNFKKCFAVFPDGTKKEFKSPKFLCEYFNIQGGATNSIYLTMKNEPYKIKPSNHSKNKRYDLEGIMIEFENQQS